VPVTLLDVATEPAPVVDPIFALVSLVDDSVIVLLVCPVTPDTELVNDAAVELIEDALAVMLWRVVSDVTAVFASD
jgi:hypothetical protein